MAFFSWSKTAASNANADGTINWSEGQPPASVNDSARAMMARLAEFRDDTSGLLVTGGTSTAYTLTTNQGLSSTPNDGQLIAFSPNATNGNAATLAADGGTAFPLQTSPGVGVVAGVLVQGTPYLAKFSVSASAWVLVSFFQNPFTIPIGAIVPYVGSSAPSSAFVFPFGQAISRTTYATLFTLCSTTFGSGDGSTTFNIPDLRGRGIFGQDNMGGSAANRITVAGGNFDGTQLGNTGGAQNHTLVTNELPAHNHSITDPGHTHTYTSLLGAPASVFGSNVGNTLTTGSTGSSATGITINNAGGGAAHTVLNPAIILPFILRII